ncbi:homocysteine S-methyltransferase family protein [Agarivorans sp. Alg241-V36]|uniref:homocysteine S-methyltransferase family protein n=1 Tax=Agarivorans sp. Alg241-V36 TaxID=2305992 RepID=UPI0013D31DA5|nr:homocysteine S-methyltransferase family protein [Agarivorans sp. Alg241-V36]
MKHQAFFPHHRNKLFACYTGLETELVYRRGFNLPGFAAYPLLATPSDKLLLGDYYKQLIQLASELGVGCILDSVSWTANRDRAAALGITVEQLKQFNIEAIEFIAGIKRQNPDVPIVLSAQVGPRDDGYAPSHLMNVHQAFDYHSEQIAVCASTEVDLISAFTICYPEEAIGIVKAAKKYTMPVAVAFTLETDGRLPTGMSLQKAIAMVDAQTDSAVLYYLINCAHPSHFSHILDGGAWMQRLRGLVVNASCCSHQTLEQATELDEGNPAELGKQVAELHRSYPQLNILGGCCGTDMRHMRSIFEAVKARG